MNPFLMDIRGLDGSRVAALNVDDRVRTAERFDLAECEAALELPRLQQTVRRAVERRLRQLRMALA